MVKKEIVWTKIAQKQRKLIITGFWDNRQNPKSLLKIFMTT
ncbi:MAG: hypothetical protein ACI87N_002715 [Flavobacteriales bacterium]|jgi:hypothetical protein